VAAPASGATPPDPKAARRARRMLFVLVLGIIVLNIVLFLVASNRQPPRPAGPAPAATHTNPPRATTVGSN